MEQPTQTPGRKPRKPIKPTQGVVKKSGRARFRRKKHELK